MGTCTVTVRTNCLASEPGSPSKLLCCYASSRRDQAYGLQLFQICLFSGQVPLAFASMLRQCVSRFNRLRPYQLSDDHFVVSVARTAVNHKAPAHTQIHVQTHSITHTHTITRTQSQTHTHTINHTHTQSHTHTITHTHTRTHSDCFRVHWVHGIISYFKLWFYGCVPIFRASVPGLSTCDSRLSRSASSVPALKPNAQGRPSQPGTRSSGTGFRARGFGRGYAVLCRAVLCYCYTIP